MPMQPRTEQVLSPQTDAADGARVCGVQATVLRIVHPTLRAVDLCDSPHLQELDLRDLDGREDLHLTVQGCPSLAWLRLPEQGRAFVHIDGGEQRPALRIDAQLVQLDACWHGGKFMLQAERNAHWRSARIGPLSGLPPQGAQDEPADTEEVRVVTGSTGGTSLVLTPSDGNRWRELLLIDLPELQQLRCELPMQRLTISQAPALQRFDLQAPVGHIEISGCERLEHITGAASTDRLDLRGGSGARAGVEIDLAAGQIDLAGSPLRTLVLRQPSRLRLEQCLHLHKTELATGTRVWCVGHVPLSLDVVEMAEIDDGTFRRLQQACADGDLSAWKSLCHVLPMCRNELLPGVLMTLLKMLQSGIDAATVWKQRCRLAARLMVPSSRRRAGHRPAWRWSMPSDLGADGWRADWLLWQGCRHLPDAARMGAAMAADLCYQTEILDQMLGWWLHGGKDQPAFPEFFTAMLVHARDRRPMPQPTRRYLVSLSISMLRPGASPVRHYPALRQAAHDFLLKHLPRCQVLALLAHQIRQDPVEVRGMLVRLLSDPPHQGDSRLSGPEFGQLARILILSGRLPEGFRPISTLDHPFPHHLLEAA